MELARSLLQQILLGGSLEDKLAGFTLAPSQLDWERGWDPTFAAPEQPGRTGRLAASSRESAVQEGFPRHSDLMGADSLRHRGRVLHYFANHELLAIETMAFTLLRFPDAPVEFKQGVFRILQEEQQHLSSYLARMKEYGVEMGAVPLNLYLWNSLKTLQSPMDFVTRMSLTFEQANLDFALEYARVFASVLDDEPTAKLLQKVHDDEITHVAHGLYWFNRWRAEERGAPMGEWEDYRRRLPFPMSARRARGSSVFFAEESRRKAGFSEDYIESVRITGGSRGRVPDLWFYNPQCEIEAGMGPDAKWSKALRDKIVDYEAVLFWLGQESDVVLQEREPPRAWLKHVFEWRGEIPEWVRSASEVDRPVETLKPWGWGRSAFELQAGLGRHLKKQQRLPLADFEQKLLSKAWWKRQLGTAGAVVRNAAELEAYLASAPPDVQSWILKAEHSTSGRGHQLVSRADAANIKWGSDTQKVVEPYYDKAIDFSVQYEIGTDGKIKAWEPRLFETDGRHQYVRSFLGAAQEGERRAFHRRLEMTRPQWSAAHKRVGELLREAGYAGPYGIDGLITRSPSGEGEVVPVIEVNVRLTFGRIAHEIERLLRPKGIFEAEMRLYTQGQLPDPARKVIWVTPPEAGRANVIAVHY